MNFPAIIAVRAIKRAGKESVSLTRFSALGNVENVLVISGKEADMVIMDMMVRLLTSKRATFTCQLSVFIMDGVKRNPWWLEPPGAFVIVGLFSELVLYHFPFHEFREHCFKVLLFV